ncbi:MAG: septal ring lytic transglycosylase RlpA family protein [Rhodothermia bacterium]|nr:septal ring lytic transglycosylase RlpA family protein [Rhodothermia bacterium]
MHFFKTFVAAVCLVLPVALPASGQDKPSESIASASYGSGYAGVYPDILEGRVTASGALYAPDRLVAAHRTLPIGSYVRVVNLDNGRHIDVHIIDRGPFSGDRIMDLSERAARAIGMDSGDEKLVRVVHPSSAPGSVPESTAGRSPGASDEAASIRVAEYGAKTWTGNTGFTIQLGSFSTLDGAETVKLKVDGSWIHEVEVDGQTFFRLNYGRYDSREKAARDIANLESEGFFGFVKSVAG